MRPLLGCADPIVGLVLQSMPESIYAFVLEELESAKGYWTQVAKATRMSKRTIEKIARREVKDPGVSHIEKLAAYFRSSASSRTRRLPEIRA